MVDKPLSAIGLHVRESFLRRPEGFSLAFSAGRYTHKASCHHHQSWIWIETPRRGDACLSRVGRGHLRIERRRFPSGFFTKQKGPGCVHKSRDRYRSVVAGVPEEGGIDQVPNVVAKLDRRAKYRAKRLRYKVERKARVCRFSA